MANLAGEMANLPGKAHGVADPAAIETPIHALLFDRRGPSFVEEITLQAIPRTGGVLALKALLACGGLATFDTLVTMTMGTQHG
jgi:hypothetical protein